MNNKGAGMLLALITAALLFMVGMLVVDFFKPEIDNFRTSMGCGGNETSDGTKVACLGGDLTIPYLMIIIISTAGGVVLSRLTL